MGHEHDRNSGGLQVSEYLALALDIERRGRFVQEKQIDVSKRQVQRLLADGSE